MGKKIFIFAFLSILAVFQVSVMPNFFADENVPNLVLVLVVLWSARLGFEKAWRIVLGAGLLLDILSFSIVGTNVLIFTIVSFCVSYLAKRFLVAHQAWRLMILTGFIILGAVLEGVLRSALNYYFSGLRSDYPAISFSADAYRTLFTLLTFLIIYWPVRKIERFLNFYGQRFELKKDVR